MLGGKPGNDRESPVSANTWRKRQQAESTSGSAPTLLSRTQEILLWQELADEEWRSLAAVAADAWRLAHAWQIDLQDPGLQETRGGGILQSWSRRMQDRLDASNLITSAQIQDLIRPSEEPLHLLAFEEITAQQRAFFERTRQSGMAVEEHPPASRAMQSEQRLAVASRSEEFSLAAQWARQTLHQDPNACIGVVFPYLADSHWAIEHVFAAEFEDIPEAVDLSAGAHLADQPIWRAAKALLSTLMNLRQPQSGQLRGEAWLAEAFLSLRARPFLQLGSQANELLPALARQLFDAPEQQSLADWTALFLQLLRQANWGHGAGSAQYQAKVQIDDQLAQCQHGSPGPIASRQQALQLLDSVLTGTPFGPARAEAPIQVLGALETTGLVFSHLWVAGMEADRWPAPPTPNPLIPLKVQRKHEASRIDARTELEFSHRRTRLWRASTHHLVVSWAKQVSHEAQRPSPLLQDIPETSQDQLIPGRRTRRHPNLALPPPPSLELAPPDQAPARQPGNMTGGSSILRDQAQCPFRAWAVHRLGLRAPEQTPDDFPDALSRGHLAHVALLHLYDCLDTEAASEGRTEALHEAADRALASELPDAPAMFRAQERKRLVEIMTAWLDREAQRPEFTLIEREVERTLALNGETFTLRLDRIDRDERSGEQILIDYKTGQTQPARLDPDNLTEPQLPLYALTDEAIHATLFAEVGRADSIKLKGRAARHLHLKLDNRGAEVDWPHLRNLWQERLSELVDGFRQGQAEVKPKPGACDHCHLHGFCRVAPRLGGLAP